MMELLRIGILAREGDLARRIRDALAANPPADCRLQIADCRLEEPSGQLAIEADLVLADYRLVAERRFAALRRLRGRGVPVVVVSDVPGEEHAVAALRAGADHYLTLARLDALGAAVGEVLAEPEGRRGPGARCEASRSRLVAILETTTDLVWI